MGIRRLKKFSKIYGNMRSIPEYFLDALATGCSVVTPDKIICPLLIRRGSTDWRVFIKIFIDKEYEINYGTEEFELVIDAGANNGYSSVYFASRFPNAKIIAIEPDVDNFKMLLCNTRQFKNIECLFGALWPTQSKVSIINNSAPKWAYQVGNATTQQASLPVFTMEDLTSNIRGNILFKCDIEGAETQIFLHSKSWIRRIKAIVCELHDGINSNSSRAFHIATQEFDQHLIHGENSIVIQK